MLFGICLFVKQTHHLNIPIDPDRILIEVEGNSEKVELKHKIKIFNVLVERKYTIFKTNALPAVHY